MPLDALGFDAFTALHNEELRALKQGLRRLRDPGAWWDGAHPQPRGTNCAIQVFSGRHAVIIGAISRLRDELPPGQFAVQQYNDLPSTKHGDIIALFERAIEAAQ